MACGVGDVCPRCGEVLRLLFSVGGILSLLVGWSGRWCSFLVGGVAGIMRV